MQLAAPGHSGHMGWGSVFKGGHMDGSILSSGQVETADGWFWDSSSLSLRPYECHQEAVLMKGSWNSSKSGSHPPMLFGLSFASKVMLKSPSRMLIEGDFNMTLEAKDRPNNMGGWDPDLEEFCVFITKATLIKMGPMDCVYTWRSMTGWNIRSQLDRFLCSVELAEGYPLADVRSRPRPLWNHTPLVWAKNEGIRKPTYFKMDRSWLWKVGFKEEMEKAWQAQSRHTSQIETLAGRTMGLQQHLLWFRKHMQEERNKRRSEALTWIKQVDDLEDIRMLEKACERRRCKGVVAKEDHKREMDWQRSRQI